MPKIRFLAARVLRDEFEGTPDETVYKEGQVLTVSEASAQHWLNRGVAELVEDEGKKPVGRPRKQEPVEEGSD